MRAIDIRPATKSDASIVFALYSELQNLHFNLHPQLFHAPTNDDIFQAFFDAALRNDNEHMDIGYFNQEPFGYIHFIINRFDRNLYYHPRSRIYIEQVVVASDSRGKGYGRALIDHVIQAARQLRIFRIELDTWSFNRDAKKCFIQQGFSTFLEKMSLQVPEQV
jgi:GNAT superfamily N-acetyltransferase